MGKKFSYVFERKFSPMYTEICSCWLGSPRSDKISSVIAVAAVLQEEFLLTISGDVLSSCN